MAQDPTASLESSSFLDIGKSSGGTASWALELLTIMLLVGLAGLIRAAPFADRVRARATGREPQGVVTGLRDTARRDEVGQAAGTAAPKLESDELAA